MRSMRSMRGGIIFRNRGPSLKVHHGQCPTRMTKHDSGGSPPGAACDSTKPPHGKSLLPSPRPLLCASCLLARMMVSPHSSSGTGAKTFDQLRPGGRSPPVSYSMHVVFCLFLCVSLCCAFCNLVMCLYQCSTVFCLLVSTILCSPSLCHISITISSSYLLFLYTCIHHCLYHTFPFLELFLATALTFQ
jgi:hypothetical protein